MENTILAQRANDSQKTAIYDFRTKKDIVVSIVALNKIIAIVTSQINELESLNVDDIKRSGRKITLILSVSTQPGVQTDKIVNIVRKITKNITHNIFGYEEGAVTVCIHVGAAKEESI